MVGLIVRDMAASLEFYRRLGIEIPEGSEEKPFVRKRMQSGASILWDTVFADKYDPGGERPESGYLMMLEFSLEDESLPFEARAVDARRKGRRWSMPNKPPGRQDPKGPENAAPAGGIEVRWGLREDEAQIAELMELNGMRRASASEERFIVAERDGKILAALRYRTEPKRLLLGLLISDPWAEELPLAVTLYARAGELAREMGAREVRARPVPHADDHPYEAGYRWRYPAGWYLDARRPLHRREGLPAGGWRRMAALLGVPAAPFFSAFGGAGRRMGGSK
jgi:hypothetical protein